MKTILKSISLLLIASVAIISCKKDPDEDPAPTTPVATKGSISIEFENMVSDSALIFNTKPYVNANNDTFTVSVFKYYISNIVLTKSDNSIYVEPNSYHLVDAADETTGKFTLSNVPVGDYKSISFMIGVDSAHNVSGAQTGALDPANGMFWSWSSGYIMAKVEGHSPQSTATNNIIMFHTGGFSGNNSVLRKVSPSFNGETANVSGTITPEIHFKADVLEWFTSPNNISFSALNTVHMPGANAKLIADNYADMFSVEHIHN